MTGDAAALLSACGFPARWLGAARCVMLHTHVGDGQGVLAAWHAWRSAQAAAAGAGAGAGEGAPLVLVAIAGGADWEQAADAVSAAHVHAPWADLARRLAAMWPPATPDLHVLDLEPGVRLLLALGRRPWLRLLRVQADLVLFDPQQPPPGAAGPSPWDTHALKALARLAAPEAAWPLGPALRTQAAVPVRARQPDQAAASRHAIVIGAGIAGACTARALVQSGWTCTVLDAHPAPAQGASGNPAALFHGTVHPGDGLHARFTRACALRAAQQMRSLVAAGVAGDVGGLVRAHAKSSGPGGTPADSAWPSAWVQQLEGTPLQQRLPGLRANSAWFFPGGGWIAADAAVRWLLAAPGIDVRTGTDVHTLQACSGGWRALDACGGPLAQAHSVVLASAGRWPPLQLSQLSQLLQLSASSGPRLESGAVSSVQPALPPAQRSRGQVTWFDSTAALPHPVAGHGYAVKLPGGPLLCGATSHEDNDAAGGASQNAVGLQLQGNRSDDDHLFNLQRLAQLTGLAPPAGAPWQGRVGWRHLTPDRLPLVGAVPCTMQAQPARLERLREVARAPGLWVLAGLGGRGFTWAPLLGEVVAALVTGGPLPMESRLLDAADPARHLLRQARRAAAA